MDAFVVEVLRRILQLCFLNVARINIFSFYEPTTINHNSMINCEIFFVPLDLLLTSMPRVESLEIFFFFFFFLNERKENLTTLLCGV